MKLFHVVEGVMVRLSGIPGLQFLGSFVAEHQAESARRKQVIGKYVSYVQSLRGAASEVTQHGHEHGASHGNIQRSKNHIGAKDSGVDEEIAEDIDDDYENEEDDDFESYML